MGKQRLYKVICCVALSVSVFLCNFTVSLADDSWTSISDSDIQFTSPYGFFIDSFTVWDDALSGDYQATVQRVVYPVQINAWPYLSGSVIIACPLELWIESSTSDTSKYCSFNVTDFGMMADYEGVTVSSLRAVHGPWWCYVGQTQTRYVEIVLEFDGSARYTYPSSFAFYIDVTCYRTESDRRGWVTPKDASLNANSLMWSSVGNTLYSGFGDVADRIIANQNQVSTNEMQQQQQIANLQSQQSAQQHEDLKNGFKDDTYTSNVSNAGNTVDNYISLESDLMQSQNQALSDYVDSAFNANTMSPYVNAIAMVSTWYTWIWNAFGEFNVGFVVALAVGVACLIIGIRKRG